MNILVVDDEKLVLRMTEKVILDILPTQNIRAFSDAEEALDYAKTMQIDIAFLDINMRYIDGIQIAKQLQEMYPKVNIIFCTGYSEYAVPAHDLYCSAYLLKPITKERVEEALCKLRYPVVSSKEKDITVRCFGYFEVYYQGKPMHFKRSKSKELLAYLIDRQGVDCPTREVMTTIFGTEDSRAYFDQLRMDLLHSFDEIGHSEIIRQRYGSLGVEKKLIGCDYYDYLNFQNDLFDGEYMNQYAWAEYTREGLIRHAGVKREIKAEK